ncbi:Inactive protein kinase [Nymphaea thermarum]|nr:Inactive protein kinase [Nymphaea thermarum]
MATTPQSNITRLSYLLTLLLAVLQFPSLLHASYEGYSLFDTFQRGNDSLYISCSNSTDGLSQTYGQNLEQLFRSLVDSVNSTGFWNTSVGESTPYAAYGLSLCRGDLSANICRNCIADATESAKVACPNNRSAMIWINTDCLLHFSDTRFFGTVTPRCVAWADDVLTTTYSADLNAQGFVIDLVNKTANEQAMFDTKVAKLQRDNTSYGMAQCTRDLSKEACVQCLGKPMNELTHRNFTLARPWVFVCSSCYIRYNTSRFFAISTAPAPAPSSPSASQPPGTVESSPAGSKSGDQRKTAIIIGSTVGMSLLAIGIFMLLFRSRKGKELNEELRRYRNEMASLGNLPEDERNDELPQYSLKAVQVATNNFSEENKLGRGGFGPVHKGELNGRVVAVKRLSESSGQGLNEFMNEIILIAKLQHKNLVRLLGCCVERGEKMLIYEFMPNGSLDAYFHANSFAYFGSGYMAPEYAIDGQFSVKSDVYSFGVLLLEIVSGQTYGGFHFSKMGYSLIGYAWTLWHKGSMSDFIDPLLGESAPTSQILRCFHIGLLCVQEDAANRPTMSAIIKMLESDSPMLAAPQQPPLAFSRAISTSSNLQTTSTNDSSKSGSTSSQSLVISNPSFRCVEGVDLMKPGLHLNRGNSRHASPYAAMSVSKQKS